MKFAIKFSLGMYLVKIVEKFRFKSKSGSSSGG